MEVPYVSKEVSNVVQLDLLMIVMQMVVEYVLPHTEDQL